MTTIENAPAGENTSPASSLKIPLSDDYFVQIANLLKNYVSSPAQGMVFYYNGTNWTGLAVGTNGQLLQTQGAAANPVWATVSAQTLLDVISTTQGVVLYYNGTDWVALSPGTSGQFLKTLGAGANPLWAAPPSSVIVQVVHTQTGAVATGTTVVPYDDTIPQNTEGDQYMTLAITPTNASNKLVIEVTAILASSALGQMWVCLFQDTTANALAVGVDRMDTVNQPYVISFKHEMIAGTISATTFKVRAGNNAAGTTTFNGSAGARYMGGVFASSIRITEVQV